MFARQAVYPIAIAVLLASCDGSQVDQPNLVEAAEQSTEPALQPTGPVTDAADIFDATQERRLREKLGRYNVSARHPIVIASVPSMQGQPAQKFADDLASRWKVGQDDRGVFILIALAERSMWISVADGTLPVLPDTRTQDIVDQTLPLFKRGEFYKGADAAVDALTRV